MLFTRFSRKAELEPVEPPAPEPVPVTESRSLPVIESGESVGTQSVTLEELERLPKSGDKVILLDVRTERSRDTSDSQAEGSIRMEPENVVMEAQKLKLPKEAWLIAYCA